MKKILNITSGIHGENSVSNKLAGSVVKQLLASYPDSEVTTYDLEKHPLPHLNRNHFTAFNVAVPERSAEQQSDAHYSDTAVNDLMEADFIVIGVPLYNFNIPSTLKAWIDHIVRPGITFNYTENGPLGLVQGKKVYLAMASGGVYSYGPMADFDVSEKFLRNVLGFLGMKDITTFRAEGIKMPALAETALPNAVAAVNEYAF